MSSKPLIICVDDERIMLDSLRSELHDGIGDDYDIEIAQSADEAIEILEECRNTKVEVPLIISDQVMPGVQGDELLIKIHTIDSNIKKILLTGQASADAVGNAVNHAELYRYIAKPWDIADLILTVKQAIKAFFEDKTLEEENRQLKKLNAELEEKLRSISEK